MSARKHAPRGEELEAVRTTIVGGRPQGGGKAIGNIPRGIEVLVKKASVDRGFRNLLLERRAEAAEAIALELEPAEVVMINNAPRAQLEAIIARTTVKPRLKKVFMGGAAAVMLAALSVATSSCDRWDATAGERPDLPGDQESVMEAPADEQTESAPPDATRGIRPDRIEQQEQP